MISRATLAAVFLLTLGGLRRLRLYLPLKAEFFMSATSARCRMARRIRETPFARRSQRRWTPRRPQVPAVEIVLAAGTYRVRPERPRGDVLSDPSGCQLDRARGWQGHENRDHGSRGGRFSLCGLCQKVRVADLVVDYDPVPFCQGTIRAVDVEAGSFDLEVEAGYPTPDAENFAQGRRTLRQVGHDHGPGHAPDSLGHSGPLHDTALGTPRGPRVAVLHRRRALSAQPWRTCASGMPTCIWLAATAPPCWPRAATASASRMSWSMPRPDWRSAWWETGANRRARPGGAFRARHEPPAHDQRRRRALPAESQRTGDRELRTSRAWPTTRSTFTRRPMSLREIRSPDPVAGFTRLPCSPERPAPGA